MAHDLIIQKLNQAAEIVRNFSLSTFDVYDVSIQQGRYIIQLAYHAFESMFRLTGFVIDRISQDFDDELNRFVHFDFRGFRVVCCIPKCNVRDTERFQQFNLTYDVRQEVQSA